MPMPTSRVKLGAAHAGAGCRSLRRIQRGDSIVAARALAWPSARVTRERLGLHLQRFEEGVIRGRRPQEAALLPVFGPEHLDLADVPKGKAPPKRDDGCGTPRKLGQHVR